MFFFVTELRIEDDFVTLITVKSLLLVDLKLNWLHWSCYHHNILLLLFITLLFFIFYITFKLDIWYLYLFRWTLDLVLLIFKLLGFIITIYISSTIPWLHFLSWFFFFRLLIFSCQHFIKLFLNFLYYFDLMTCFNSHLAQPFLWNIFKYSIIYIWDLQGRWFPIH